MLIYWYEERVTKVHLVVITDHDDFCALAALCFKRHDTAVWMWAMRLFVSSSGHVNAFNTCIAALALGFLIYLVA